MTEILKRIKREGYTSCEDYILKNWKSISEDKKELLRMFKPYSDLEKQ
jgi:hypothetical protein